jgi:hypothetical protein
MRALRLVPAALALAAAPAAAESELGFTHPAELCIEERADAEFAGPYLDLILDRSGPTDRAIKLRDDFAALADACIKQHGEPRNSPAHVGELITAAMIRNEALRRLAARAVDTAWVIAAVDRAQAASGGDLSLTNDAVAALMREAPPEGLSIDLRAGSELRLLISAYALGTIRLAKLRSQTAR